MVPLAIKRLSTWSDHLVETPFISIVLEESLIDINIVVKGEILYTHTYRTQASDVIENDEVFNDVVRHIENFLYSFTNFYPDKTYPQKVVMFSRVDRKEVFFEKVQTYFKEFYCFVYSPTQNIKFHPQLGTKEKLDKIMLKKIGRAHV